jgi:hypothetical protein
MAAGIFEDDPADGTTKDASGKPASGGTTSARFDPDAT